MLLLFPMLVFMPYIMFMLMFVRFIIMFVFVLVLEIATDVVSALPVAMSEAKPSAFRPR